MVGHPQWFDVHYKWRTMSNLIGHKKVWNVSSSIVNIGPLKLIIIKLMYRKSVNFRCVLFLLLYSYDELCDNNLSM